MNSDDRAGPKDSPFQVLGAGHGSMRWCDAGRHAAAKVTRWQRVLYRCTQCAERQQAKVASS